jgi:hypothetical protein
VNDVAGRCEGWRIGAAYMMSLLKASCADVEPSQRQSLRKSAFFMRITRASGLAAKTAALTLVIGVPYGRCTCVRVLGGGVRPLSATETTTVFSLSTVGTLELARKVCSRKRTRLSAHRSVR